jgi:hypothetical protein
MGVLELSDRSASEECRLVELANTSRCVRVADNIARQVASLTRFVANAVP